MNLKVIITIFLMFPLSALAEETVKTETTYKQNEDGIKSTVKAVQVSKPIGADDEIKTTYTDKVKIDKDGNMHSKVVEETKGPNTTVVHKEVIDEKMRKDGSIVTNSTKTITTDPRGLLNRSTSKINTKVVTLPNGEKNSTIKIDAE